MAGVLQVGGRLQEFGVGKTYERDLESVLAIQNDVARAIAREVGLTLAQEGSAGLVAATRPVLPAAHDAYVRVRDALRDAQRSGPASGHPARFINPNERRVQRS